MNGHYEPHRYADSTFPIIFHTDVLTAGYDVPNVFPEQAKIFVGESSGANWHEGVEILRVLKGSVAVRINDEPVPASEGDIVAISSNCLHSITAVGGYAVYHCLIINLELCKSWGIDVSDTAFEPVFSDGRIDGIFDCISEEMYGRRSRFKQMVTAKCLELMTLLVREHVLTGGNSPRFSKKALLVRKMMTYISENCGREISLEKISVQFGYSIYYLSHIFNEYTGTSPMDYTLQIRLNAAEQMLKSGDGTVSEIAEHCGYGNASSFSTLFKRKKGMTPSEYRLRSRAGERV